MRAVEVSNVSICLYFAFCTTVGQGFQCYCPNWLLLLCPSKLHLEKVVQPGALAVPERTHLGKAFKTCSTVGKAFDMVFVELVCGRACVRVTAVCVSTHRAYAKVSDTQGWQQRLLVFFVGRDIPVRLNSHLGLH